MRDGYEDWDFWVGCIGKNWSGYRIPEPLFYYRKRADSMLGTSNTKRAYLISRIILNHPSLYDERKIALAQRTVTAYEQGLKKSELPPVRKKSLTVTYLISSILGVTGGNQTLLNQANALIDRGHRVYIVTHSEKPDYFTIKANVTQVPDNGPMSKYIPKSDAVISTYFSNTVELTRIDAPVRIYYAQGDQFIFEDETTRLSPEKERKKKVVKEFSRASYLYPGIKFIANSHNLAHAVEKAYGRKADAILPVCVDSSIFHPLPKEKTDGRMRILVVGPDMLGSDMEPLIFKGIGDIREALDKLSSRRNDFVVVRMSNSQAFIFKDFQCEFHIMPNDEMKTFLYGTADILVYASHYDSCPRPPMEAMASGAAVVCTETSGALEYCRNGENCLLVPIKSPDALCDAIERLMDDRMLRETLVRGGFKTAGRYPQEKEWDELESLLYSYYYEVVKPRSVVKGLTSIVVVLNNDHERTKECIQSIEKFTANLHEVVLVTCISKANLVKGIRNLIKGKQNYKLIEGDKNAAETRRRNQGIEASSGEYILLLNNDVLVTEGWLSGMLECINSAPDIGIVGPMTNNISGIQKVPEVPYNSTEYLDEFARGFRERNKYRHIPARRIVGFCMLFRRELVDKIGLLDEHFGSGNYEDDDFCLRAALSGYRNLIAGDVFIHRYGSRSFIGNKIDYNAAMIQSKKLFTEKWNNMDVKSSTWKSLLPLNAMEKADDLNQKGQLDKAVETLLKAIKNCPEDRRLYYSLLAMLIDAKNFKEALDVLTEMPPDEKDIQRIALMGYCNEGLEHFDEAEELADRVLSLNVNSSSALNLKGIIAYRRNQKKEAEVFFKRAFESDPSYGEPYTNLGVLKWAEGNNEEALSLLEKGFILSPTIMDIATLYHSAITTTKTFERAERVFGEARSLYTQNKKITFLLIDILLQQNKYEKAMQEIEKAMIAFGIDDGILAAAIEIRNRIASTEIDKTKNIGALSLCMIVKNEEQNLAKCLMSVKPAVDEMIVVDTGSTDRTKEIARAFGAKVYDFEWTNDFAEARNFSLSKATGHWVLILDADEMISPSDNSVLAKIVKEGQPRSVAYSLVTRNYVTLVQTGGWTANDGKYSSEEAGTGWFPSIKVRLFPNDNRIRFENPVHELVEPSLNRIRMQIRPCDVTVHHYGKLLREKVISKGEEYYMLGKKKIEDLGNNIDALCELAIQASEIGKYEEAVEVWQKVIALKPNFSKAYFNLGHAYLELGRYSDALVASKRAVDLNPHMKEAVYNYALCELFAGGVEKAVAAFEGLLGKLPDYPSAKVMLAIAYCCDSKKEKGIELLEKLQQMNFGFANILSDFAKKLVSAGQLEYAISLLDAAVESNNINQNTISLRDKCYEMRA